MSANTNIQAEQSSPLKMKQVQLSRQKCKKLSKKDIIEPNFEKQNKITHYFGASSNSTSNEKISDPDDVKLNQLKQEIIKRDKIIEKMRGEKEFFENKFSYSFMESKTYKNKAKKLLIETLSENAEMKRASRRRVDVKLGYFTKDMKFVEGEDLEQLQKWIEGKKNQCDKLEEELKKAKDDDHKDRIRFSITFIKKDMITKENQLKAKEKQMKIYRQKLKIGFQQLNCYYQAEQWKPIKDSHNNQKYLPLMLLGKGGFGQVYKCYDLEQNCHVAIKINNINIKQNSPQSTSFFRHVQREVKTHKELKHPNIAQIRQILQISKRKIVFVMDYCTGPELSLYLKQRGCIEEEDAKKIIHQVFCALNYLSELTTKVIHYDLKPSNLVFDHGVIKILDFGLCKLMDSEDSRMELTSQGVGTYWYLPPETFCHDSRSRQAATISPKVDVWSTGVIFYQLLFGVRPFGRGKSQQKILSQDLITRQSQNLSRIFEDNPNKCRISKQAKAFITQCLQINPDNRISANQAYNHPYFKC